MSQQQPPGFPASPQNPQHPPVFDVDLPAGGKLHLQSAEEVDMWEEAAKAYIADYNLTRTNDKVLLGSILTQQLAMFRAQQALNGMEAVLDANNVPTGRYQQTKLKPSEQAAAQKMIRDASAEIRDIEKSLGIDKKTRESGGAETVRDYISKLKRHGHAMGVHISKRVLRYEAFCMELKTKLRMMENLDDEDRAYHGLSWEAIGKWAYKELLDIEEVDKKYANEKGKLFIGQA